MNDEAPTRTDDARRLLRGRMRDLRRSIDPEAAARASAEVAQRLVDLDELRGPGRLGVYAPVDGEIDPGPAIARLRERGWRIHLPVLVDSSVQRPGQVPATSGMVFAEWHDGAPLRPNRFGIGEPEVTTTLDIGELDAVLVPCVAVDAHGHRLGFGAGFYDRAFGAARLSGSAQRPWDDRSAVATIAVVHDEQVVDEVPSEPWDVPVDVVVTDRRVIRRESRPL